MINTGLIFHTLKAKYFKKRKLFEKLSDNNAMKERFFYRKTRF